MSELLEPILPFISTHACIIDVVAMIDDPNGAAAERVARADPFYACVLYSQMIVKAVAVPARFLGNA